MTKIIIFDINLILKNQIKYFNDYKSFNKINNSFIKDSLFSENYYNLCRGRLSQKKYYNFLNKKYSKIYIDPILDNNYSINNDILEYVFFLKKQNININLCGDISQKNYLKYHDYLDFNKLFYNKVLSFDIGYIKQQDEEFTEILINNFETSPKNLILVSNKRKYNHIPKEYGINIINYNNSFYDLILKLKSLY